MKKLFFALLFVFPFAHAMDFSLNKDECIILVASTKSETEAQAIANKYPGAQLYTSKSGYIAIGLEKISKQESAARIKELLNAGKIPKGSNCADDSRITGLLNVDSQKPEKQAKDARTSKSDPKKKIESLSNSLAKKLGPEGSVSCLYLSARMMGTFSKYQPGSKEEGMFLGAMSMARVFSGITKIFGEQATEPFAESRTNWAKTISVTEMIHYLKANCSHPEVNELGVLGFN